MIARPLSIGACRTSGHLGECGVGVVLGGAGVETATTFGVEERGEDDLGDVGFVGRVSDLVRGRFDDGDGRVDRERHGSCGGPCAFPVHPGRRHPFRHGHPLAEEVDQGVLGEVERGQRGGTLDPDAPTRWIELMVWSTVHTGLHADVDGLVARHGVEDLIRRTLRRAIVA